MPTTWSISRDNALETCERRYYYTYCSGARANSRDPRLREIAFLKKVQTIVMWQGDVLHIQVASYLRELRRGTPDPARHIALAVEKMTQDWRASIEQAARQRSSAGAPESPAVFAQAPVSSVRSRVVLFEHLYGLDLAPLALEVAQGAVCTWLDRFVRWSGEVGLAKVLRGAKQVWIEPPMFGRDAPGFKVEDVQVITKVDLAVRQSNNRFTIYDWKTGAVRAAAPGMRDGDAEYQVTAYQLWPLHRLRVSFADIEAHVVFLASEPVVVKRYEIDPDTRERAARRIRAGITRALALHGLGDHAPMSEADFDYARHPAMCRLCAFKRVCNGGG